jgi:predicted nucleotidyltransferase
VNPNLLRGIRNVKPQFPDARFIVFGSRSRGDAREDSDLDIYVIFPELNEDPFEILYRVRRALHAELDIPLDVLISDEKRFAEDSLMPWAIENTVRVEGLAV